MITTRQIRARHCNIVVQRLGGADRAVGVTYTITDGSATTADSDYSATLATGTLSWANGDSSDRNIPITVNGDSKVELDETVNITLSSPTGGATITGTNPATLTIKNDDTVIAVAVAPSSVVEDDVTDPVLVYTFTRTGVTTGTITLNFSVGGTATFPLNHTDGAAHWSGERNLGSRRWHHYGHCHIDPVPS